MTWPVDRRLDYIDWSLWSRGTIQRGDLTRIFGVSLGQASADLQEFFAEHPDAAVYDKYQKTYVPAKRPYRRQRKSVWTRAIDWSATRRMLTADVSTTPDDATETSGMPRRPNDRAIKSYS